VEVLTSVMKNVIVIPSMKTGVRFCYTPHSKNDTDEIKQHRGELRLAPIE